ncbi:MAG: amidase family protein [Oscillospiraceae bacterium]|nr:amidase family protein [Oscillospiraceae bacterium]
MRFMLEDSIMVKDSVCTAGSRVLNGFKAPFSATVYDKCVAQRMEYAGSVVSDEFGIDALFDSPHDLAAADAASVEEPLAAPITNILEGRCDTVLCNDTFGKLRRQAAQNRLIYIRPSYGVVSRFGLIQAVPSMDQIGVLCRNIKDGIEMLSTISGYDENDGTSIPKNIYMYSAGRAPEKTIRIGFSKSLRLPITQDTAECTTSEADAGPRFIEVDLKYFDKIEQVFYILASAEICGATNRYDGVKFGLRAGASSLNDMYVKSRSEGFGRDLKLAVLVGCMVLSHEHYEKLYYKSMQLRGLMKDYYDNLFSQVDAIILPAEIQGASDKYAQSALYSLPSLCGYSAISFRIGSSPVQLIAPHGGENAVFSFVESLGIEH